MHRRENKRSRFLGSFSYTLYYYSLEALVPLSELLEDDAIGETLSANADALQDTVAPQLIQDQMGVELPRLAVSGNLENGRSRLSAIKLIKKIDQ